MKKCAFLLLVAVVVGGSSTSWAADSFSEAMTSGQAHVIFRYRLENVDQDGMSKDATASTLKTRINYKSDSFNGFSVFAEMDDVSYIGDDDFYNFANGKNGQYPVIADPDGTNLNQFYVDYKTDNALFRLGRQRILLDNQRYVGGAGWRQNEQTYDALKVVLTGLTNNVITYAYIDNVSRIFGPDSSVQAMDWDSSIQLLNWKYKSDGFGSLVGYGYFLDIEDSPVNSSSTIGLRYQNAFKLDGGWSIPITLEYADQSDYKDNTANYSVGYFLASIGVKTPAVAISINHEVLEADSGGVFRTPLASLHAHQGWNDKFLGTPAGGIEDTFLKIGGKVAGTKVTFVYHDYSSESGGGDLGSEFNLAIAKKINDHWSILFKYSAYDSDGHSVDTDKAWFMVTAKF